jgi:hypothetical protein
MEFANAIKLDRKSGGMGHPGLVIGEGFQAWTSGGKRISRVYRSVRGLTGSRIQAVVAK